MKKIPIFILLVTAICTFIILDLDKYLSLEQIQVHKDWLLQQTLNQPLVSFAAYSLTYILVTALSLPGAVPLTLLGGFLFGTLKGTLFVSFASTAGATLAFLTARYLMRDQIEKKFQKQMKKLNDKFEQEGPLALFTLRLIPLIPFFIINVGMGLTKISVKKFFLISQIGMLPGTFVYVNAGTQLQNIKSAGDILSLPFILSLALIAILPWGAKLFINKLTKTK